MIDKFFIRTLDALSVKLGLYRIGFLCLAAIVLFQTIQINTLLKSQKVILIPPGGEEMIVTNNYANEAYLRREARYIAGLTLTYSPHSIKGQYEELIGLYHISLYGAIRPVLEKIAKRVALLNISQVFIPQGVLKYDLKARKIYIEGVLQQTINNEKQKDQTKSYVIHYQIVDSKFFLLEMYPDESKK